MRRVWEYVRGTWQGQAAAPWMRHPLQFYVEAAAAMLVSAVVPLIIVYGTSLPAGAKWAVLTLGVGSFALSFPLMRRRERRKISSRPPARLVSFPPPPSSMWKKRSKEAGWGQIAESAADLLISWIAVTGGLTLLPAAADGWDGWANFSSGPAIVGPASPIVIITLVVFLVWFYIGLLVAVAAWVVYVPGTYREGKQRYMAEISDLVSPGVAKVAKMRKTVAQLGPAMESLEELSRDLAVLQEDLAKELESKETEFSEQLRRLLDQQQVLQLSEEKRDAVLAEWERMHQGERRRDRAWDVSKDLVFLVLGLAGGVLVSQVWGR